MPSILHKTSIKSIRSNYPLASFFLLESFGDIEVGYKLDTDKLSEIETWTSVQEEMERMEIFELFVWFPVSNFDCEYCGHKKDVRGYNLQYGFAYQPDDYDRVRILCNDCVED